MKKEVKIKWFPTPEEHDYPAALSYLSLIYDETTAKLLVDHLKHSKIVYFKTKDIFRASKESLLGISNVHVKSNLKKIKKGKKLSPLLLVRDSNAARVIIADGYHRICATYRYDEDLLIPCQITDL